MKIDFGKNWIHSHILPYRPLRIEKNEWNVQFASKKWEYLREPEQFARYSVIVGYYSYYVNNSGKILDLGCGQGVLQERLKHINYSKYVGVDFSKVAIREASGKADEKNIFICSDISNFCPQNSFDFIVFNEVLYYFKNPLEIMKKFESSLSTNGVFVVSMWYSEERNNKIWPLLESRYFVENEIQLTAPSQKSWIIKVFRPNVS